jgi:AbiTii
MTLLREIQAAATDSKTDIATVLRKAKILAARLQNLEFRSWVDQELNGYEGIVLATAAQPTVWGWIHQILKTF